MIGQETLVRQVNSMNRRNASQWAFGLLFVAGAASLAVYPQLKRDSVVAGDGSDLLPHWSGKENRDLFGIRTNSVEQQVRAGARLLLSQLGQQVALAADEATPAKTYDVETLKDVAYYDGDDADKVKHKLDLYLPKDKKDFPVLFFVHGGAW